MKRFVLFLLSLLWLIFSSFGQSEEINRNDSTAEVEITKVMLIPVQETFYFSDADQQLAQYNRKNPSAIRSAFISGVDLTINSQILRYTPYRTEQMFVNKEPEVYQDLEQIYKGLDYFYDNPSESNLVEDEREENSFLKRLKEIAEPKERLEAGEEVNTVGRVHPGGEGDEYMNVRIQNPAMLKYLHEKYGTKYFFFVNQFEVKTNYAHCLDRASNNFERELVMHFSIYDKNAKQVYGNSVTFITDSNTRDMQTILQEFIPEMCKYAVTKIPYNVAYRSDQ